MQAGALFLQNRHFGFESKNRSKNHRNLNPKIEEKLKKIRTSGGCLSNDSYHIINYLYETPTRVVYNFTFKEDELQWDTEVKNYRQEYVAPQIPLSLKSIKNE